MLIGLLGLNHKVADLRIREIIAKAFQKCFASDAHVLLSTCNRTELYFSSEDLAATHEEILGLLRRDLKENELQRLYSFFGGECFGHLARVTAGLDSAVVGETEIQGQVKQAYEQAEGLSRDLHFLFQKSLRIGKKVRSSLDLRPGMHDTESAILALAKMVFGGLEELSILFVGASEINDKVLRQVRQRGIGQVTVCNRTQERALLLARDDGVAVESWDHVGRWHTHDVVVFGTKCPDYLLTWNDVPALQMRKLIVDLSVPRNVDPDLEHHPHIALYNIDRIHTEVEKSRKLKAELLDRAIGMVETEVDRHFSLAAI